MVEPFCGMASMTLAGAQENGMADEYWLNDLNGDVAGVLHAAIDEPERLASEYENAWNEQFDWDGGHVEHYLHVRDEYNHGRANDGMFLYLVARVAKGSIRYSSKGMNQYADIRRHGTKPDTMRRNIMGIHGLLHGRTRITSLDYRDVLAECGADDIVYMDTLYQGTSGREDSRYPWMSWKTNCMRWMAVESITSCHMTAHAATGNMAVIWTHPSDAAGSFLTPDVHPKPH